MNKESNKDVINQSGFTHTMAEKREKLRNAKENARRIIYSMGFAAKEHIAMAQKLVEHTPKECFTWVVESEKHKCPEEHLKFLGILARKVRILDQQSDDLYAQLQKPIVYNDKAKMNVVYQRRKYDILNKQIEEMLPRFAFNWRFLEEVCLIADYIDDKLHRYSSMIASLPSELQDDCCDKRKLRELEEFVRMPAENFTFICRQLKTVMDKINLWSK
jgi:hypothetical protein